VPIVERAIAALTIASFLTLFITTAQAHDPKRRARKPTKASKRLKESRSKIDAAKAKLAKEGKYTCCTKPSCDLCARTNGKCECAHHVAAGHGACGECLEGWQAGSGTVKGVEAKSVALRPVSKLQVEDQLARIEEIVLARKSMDEAKRILVAEGGYTCCIRSGCDSCAHAGHCPCGARLARLPSPAKAGKPKSDDDGVCGECLDGWRAGLGAFKGVEPDEIKLEKMNPEMPSSFGVGSMSRQGSGTSWLPESTPIYAFSTYAGSWMLMAHATAFVVYTSQPGSLGDQQLYSTNWMMGLAQREVAGLTRAGPGVLMLRGMISFDPLTVGGAGYPLLFQTGETYQGVQLTNRQHPHDFLMELAVAYSAPLTEKTVLSVYAAPMGEPALGPTAFPHRLSAVDNPEAPLSHHWQDATHIAAGVVTIGLAREKWKIEASTFTGREPDENRWGINHPKFDSWSTRFSVNPNRNLSMQVSYGFMNSPEAFQENLFLHRVTASASYHRFNGDRSYWATTFVWGRNYKGEKGYGAFKTDSFLIESTYSFKGRRSVFGRYENVEKEDLFGGGHVHGSYAEIFRVQRLTLGGAYHVPLPGPFEWGVGATVGYHVFPPRTRIFFGDDPLSASVFLRLRPRRWGTIDHNRK
jgi:hypothetical protein